MQKIKTRDNSFTLFNEKYQEAYHSETTGAIEEALVKYAEPSNLQEGMVILDFCFGLGYNTLAALTKLNQAMVIALENDPEILKEIQTIEVPAAFQEKYEMIRQVAKNHRYDDGKIKIKLLLGDARETIKTIREKFDVVFFDPFSPKKCPELWTKEVFQAVYQVMKPGAILTTYSCARIVRDNLKAAGFQTKDGPILGRYGPGTIAIKL